VKHPRHPYLDLQDCFSILSHAHCQVLPEEKFNILLSEKQEIKIIYQKRTRTRDDWRERISFSFSIWSGGHSDDRLVEFSFIEV
jgi:hypothetical protein